MQYNVCCSSFEKVQMLEQALTKQCIGLEFWEMFWIELWRHTLFMNLFRCGKHLILKYLPTLSNRVARRGVVKIVCVSGKFWNSWKFWNSEIPEILKSWHSATLFHLGRFKIANWMRLSVVMWPGEVSTLHLIDLDSQSRRLSFFQVLSNEATEAGLMWTMEKETNWKSL